MTSRLSIVKKTSTLPNEMIHIMFKCVVHLHGHWKKMVPFTKPFIFTNLSNDNKFHSYTWWSINDIQEHHFSHQVNNHHISNEDLVFLGYV